jgi:hypothetical protein
MSLLPLFFGWKLKIKKLSTSNEKKILLPDKNRHWHISTLFIFKIKFLDQMHDFKQPFFLKNDLILFFIFV